MKKLEILLTTAALVGLHSATASVISINFREDNGNPNQTIAPGTSAGGGAGVVATNWNNLLGGSGNQSGLVDADGLATTASIQWSSGGMWGDGEANADADAGVGSAQLLRGYLDDNQGGPDPILISVDNVPFSEYRVAFFFSTDTDGDGGIFGPVTVTTAANDELVISTTGGKFRYGTTGGLDDSNSASTDFFSGSSFSFEGPVRDGSTRHSLAGMQIIQIPEPSSTAALLLTGLVVAGRRRRVS